LAGFAASPWSAPPDGACFEAAWAPAASANTAVKVMYLGEVDFIVCSF
jgi:hypothetical protein